MDPMLHTFEKIRWAPIVQIVILCVGTLISFIVAYAKGDVSIYLPFISETGAKVPAMCLFTFTLIFGSVAGFVTVCYRVLVLRHLLLNADKRLTTLSDAAGFIGLVSMAGLAGVAAFPVSTVFWSHLLAAGVHFLFGLVYIILQTFLSHYVPGANATLNRIKILCCVLVLLLLVLLVIFFPLAFMKWHEANYDPPAVKTPYDEYFGLMFTSALFEWVMYGIFLAFLSTFWMEFRHFHLTIGVVPISPKTEQST